MARLVHIVKVAGRTSGQQRKRATGKKARRSEPMTQKSKGVALELSGGKKARKSEPFTRGPRTRVSLHQKPTTEPTTQANQSNRCNRCGPCLLSDCGICGPCRNPRWRKTCIERECVLKSKGTTPEPSGGKKARRSEPLTLGPPTRMTLRPLTNQPTILPTKALRRNRCNQCGPCLLLDCGICEPCRNPSWKKICIERKCVLLRPLTVRGTPQKVSRCKECNACNRVDCGVCIFCKDMKKFGGLGHRKQACSRRRCNMVPTSTILCDICGRYVSSSSSRNICRQCKENIQQQKKKRKMKKKQNV